LFQATADAGYAHPERVSPPRDFLADGAQAKDGHLSPLQTPGPSITRQLVLNPAAIALRIEHDVESPRKHEQAAHHVFSDRNRLNSSRIRNEDATRSKFIEREKVSDSGCRRMHPSQSWSAFHHCPR
jgi:hypothetical protein